MTKYQKTFPIAVACAAENEPSRRKEMHAKVDREMLLEDKKKKR